MSQKTILYEGVKEELTGISYTKGDGSIGRLQTVAMWRNQIHRDNKENPIKYPAALIEFVTSNHMEGSSKVFQQVDMRVKIHLLFESYVDDDLDVLRLSDAVFTALQLKQWGYWGVMKRREEYQDFDHDQLQDFVQEYDCGKGKDYGADKRPTTDATIGTINLTVEKVNDLE